MDVAEIDAFLAEEKNLLGGLPAWYDSGYAGELAATWSIQDAAGIIRSQFRFRCDKRDRTTPSVSLLYQSCLIWRVDLAPVDVCEHNPPGALALGLPAQVRGPHSHSWPFNREYVRSAGFGTLPYRAQLAVQIRRLPQAMLWLSTEIKLTVTPEQRGFDVPARTDLFQIG